MVQIPANVGQLSNKPPLGGLVLTKVLFAYLEDVFHTQTKVLVLALTWDYYRSRGGGGGLFQTTGP